jgi:GR25 family glycosyltransferase involved in LPS biosynthesis
MLKPIVISLIQQEERRAYIQEVLPGCEFFNAIDGRKFKLNHAILTPEAVACFLSHTTLYLQLLNREDEFFFIVEDDAKLLKPLDEIEEKMKSLPEDWDIAFFGWFSDAYSTRSKVDVNEDWMVMDSFWGFQGYIIKKSSILKIYNSLLNIDTHVDVQIGRQIKNRKINGYFLKIPLILQGGFATQIPKSKK